MLNVEKVRESLNRALKDRKLLENCSGGSLRNAKEKLQESKTYASLHTPEKE